MVLYLSQKKEKNALNTKEILYDDNSNKKFLKTNIKNKISKLKFN